MKKTILKRSMAALLSLAMLLAYAPGLAYLGIESSKTQSYAADPYTTPLKETVVFHNNDGSEGTVKMTATEAADSTVAEVKYYDHIDGMYLDGTAPKFERTGYVFDAWYTDPSCLAKYSLGNDLTKVDLYGHYDIYAGWKVTGYKATFLVDGNKYAVENVEKGQCATKPEDPVKEGQQFVGWSTTETGSVVDVENYQLASGQNFYAQFKDMPDVKVTWDLNGHGSFQTGRYVETDKAATFFEKYNSLSERMEVVPRRPESDVTYVKEEDGWTFAGWYLDAECTEPYDFGRDYYTEDMHFYAKWEVEEETVTFDVYGEVVDDTKYYIPAIDSQTVAYGEKAEKPEAPVCQGYVFQGWYVAEVNEETKDVEIIEDKPFDFNTPIEEDYLIAAKWVEADYNVTFNGNGHNIAMTGWNKYSQKQAVGVQEGKKVEEYQITWFVQNAGYEFCGWYTDRNCTEGNEFDFDSTKIYDDITLFAKWEVKKYSIVYHGNGTQVKGVMKDQKLLYNEEKELRENEFTRLGYDFKGWTTQRGGTVVTVRTNREYSAADLLEIKGVAEAFDGEIDLYAVWEAHDCYITYDANGAEVSKYNDTFWKNTQIINYNDGVGNFSTMLTKNGYEKVGYDFVGWNTKADGTGRSFTDQQQLGKTFEHDYLITDTNLTDENGTRVTLYAQWKASTYEVHYAIDADSEATYDQVMTYDQETALTANKFSKPGYYFKGWANKAEGTGVVVLHDEEVVKNLATGGTWCSNNRFFCDHVEYPEVEDVTLYAVWAKADTELLAQATPNGKKAVISWTDANGATSYSVFGAKCGKTMQYLGTVSGNSMVVSKIGKSKLYKGSKYKFYVVADTGATSEVCHTIIGNKSGKYGNVTTVSAEEEIKLSAGQASNLNASQTLYGKAKKCLGTNHAAKYRYRTSDETVAVVDASGNVIAQNPGTCYVYTQAVNGKWTTTKVIVLGTYKMIALD